MAEIGINVYLSGRGGNTTSRAKAKLSTTLSNENKDFAKKTANKMASYTTMIMGGHIGEAVGIRTPIIQDIMAYGRIANQVVGFGAGIYEAHSGETMLTHNIRAWSKTLTSAGTSYVSAWVNNMLYTRPTVKRQNYMLDYSRNLFNQNIENEKNQFS